MRRRRRRRQRGRQRQGSLSGLPLSTHTLPTSLNLTAPVQDRRGRGPTCLVAPAPPLACCNRFNRRLTFTPDHLNGCRCCCHCGLVSYLKKLSHLSSLPPRSLLVVAPRAGLRRLTDHQFHSRLGASAGGNFLKPVPATFNPIAGNKNIADAA